MTEDARAEDTRRERRHPAARVTGWWKPARIAAPHGSFSLSTAPRASSRRLTMPRLLVLALLLSLAACEASENVPTPGAPLPDSTATTDPDALDGADDDAAPAGGPGLALPALVDAAGDPALLGRLAPPQRTEATPQPNRHDPSQTDTLRTLHYDGLQLTVYDVAGSERTLLQSIEVTSAAYATDAGLRVGSTRADVAAALGAPERTEDGAAVYTVGSGPTPPALHVRYAGDAVERLTYHFYVD